MRVKLTYFQTKDGLFIKRAESEINTYSIKLCRMLIAEMVMKRELPELPNRYVHVLVEVDGYKPHLILI